MRKAHHLEGRAQGTTFHISYYANKEVVKMAEIDSIFTRIDQSMSIYNQNTTISAFNNSDVGIQMDPHMHKVVKKSLELFKQTGGLYDITLYPLIQLWGFGSSPGAAFPQDTAIKQAMTCVGSEKLRIRGRFLEKLDPCVKINLNAIAPGYTADLIAALFDKKKVKTYVIDVGGELRIKGRKPNGEFMRIGIESPTPPASKDAGSVFQRIVQLNQGALTTSGNYRQYREQGPNKASHLLDGRTGYPIQNELISVTVLAKDAMTADGYDNALMGMGLQKAFSFLKKHRELEAYFIYKKPTGQVADTATVGFYKILN